MQDIALTESLDLKIALGDFVAGESTPQHQKLLLLACPGNIMQYPEVGVGIQNFLNDDRDDMMTEIRSQFEKDGMKVASLQTNGSQMEIDAPYS